MITAIRTLTILPLPGREAEKISGSLFFFPLVGAMIGAAVCGCAWAIGLKGGWNAGAGVLCAAFSALLTGGLHLDGLADTFDALGGHTRERRLEIMKDSRVGSFGVIALVIVLLMKCAAIARLSETGLFLWIVVPFVVSRTVQVELAVILPYSRAEGGTAQSLVEGAGRIHFAAAVVTAAILGAVVCGWKGCAVAAAGCAVFLLFAPWMKRMFGGVTGDLLGMASEIAETGTLAVLALGVKWLN